MDQQLLIRSRFMASWSWISWISWIQHFEYGLLVLLGPGASWSCLLRGSSGAFGSVGGMAGVTLELERCRGEAHLLVGCPTGAAAAGRCGLLGLAAWAAGRQRKQQRQQPFAVLHCAAVEDSGGLASGAAAVPAPRQPPLVAPLWRRLSPRARLGQARHRTACLAADDWGGAVRRRGWRAAACMDAGSPKTAPCAAVTVTGA